MKEWSGGTNVKWGETWGGEVKSDKRSENEKMSETKREKEQKV